MPAGDVDFRRDDCLPRYFAYVRINHENPWTGHIHQGLYCRFPCESLPVDRFSGGFVSEIDVTRCVAVDACWILATLVKNVELAVRENKFTAVAVCSWAVGAYSAAPVRD